MGMLGQIEKLRAEALKEALNLPALAVVRSLDAAVVSAGGVSLLATTSSKTDEPIIVTGELPEGFTPPPRKVSQGDAAVAALEDNGPLPVGILLEKSLENGAVAKGKNPLTSFRSMLSKDERFVSLQRNNMYFWWFADRDLPEEFMPEPEKGLDLQGSGNNANQEGGDGHGANNTNLVS